MDKQQNIIINNSISQNNYNFSDNGQKNFNKENLGIHQGPNDLSQNYYEIIQSKLNSQNINNKN